MRYFSKSQIHEALIYIVLWLLVFLAPLLDNYYKFSSGFFNEWQWDNVFKAWIGILPFLVLFLVHELWLAPHFLIRKKHLLYVLLCVLCLGVFSTFNEYQRSLVFKDHPNKEFRKEAMRRAEPADNPARNDMSDEEMFDYGMPYGGMMHDELLDEGMMEPHGDEELDDEDHILHFKDYRNGREYDNFGRRPDKNKEVIFPFPPYFVSVIIAVLMLGLNLGIMFLFKSMRDEGRMRELKRQNLIQELEYLKYQINPHFFMNTLNNIHALIDIDTDKAKSTVIELSKLMRYVLYDSSHGNIMLAKEIEFLRHYIALMRLRYSEKVKIDVDFPDNIGEIMVPPLLLVSFVENAFKHGISYQHESFIDIKLEIEGNEMFFTCINSKHSTNADSASGIGLENVKKRLHLLFGNDYQLDIKNRDDVFEVLLVIPVNV